MKINSILICSLLAAANVSQAQTYEWRSDTLNTGTGYSQDAYFHLDSGTVKTVANNNWDLAIPGSGNGFRYVVATNNFGNGLGGTLYDMEMEPSAFGTDLSADTAGKPILHNSPEYWDQGAFTGDWGAYDISDHSIQASKLFVYSCSHGAYQILIQRYKATSDPAGRQWTLRVANLDGTDTGTYYIEPHAAGYSDEHFFFFSLENREYLSREPKLNQWHLLATKYGDAYGDTEGIFGISGIVTAPTVALAKVIDLNPDDLSEEDVAAYDDSTRNVIGGAFKYLNSSYQWQLVDSLNYFIKGLEASGNKDDIWQIYFDYFPTSTSGVDVKIGIQVRKLVDADPTSVHEVAQAPARLVLAPNPASSQVNLIIDAYQNLGKTRISIVDISGREVASYTEQLSSGFQQLRFDVAQLNAGVYLVHFQSEKYSNTQKLIVH